MKTFNELLDDRFWRSYILTWRDRFLHNAEARQRGFEQATVEAVIATFVDQVIQEHKKGKIARFAFDEVKPWRVTADGVNWHTLSIQGTLN